MTITTQSANVENVTSAKTRAQQILAAVAKMTNERLRIDFMEAELKIAFWKGKNSQFDKALSELEYTEPVRPIVTVD